MPRMKVVVALLLLMLTGSSVVAQKSEPPNIIYIMADDLGYGHVGVYGQEKIQTPNIDRLASQGMLFTQAYSENICAPTRSVLMTGLHNGNARIRSNGPGMFLYPTDVTLPEVLKQAGYATGAFGKWGLGDIGTTGVPWEQGFDQFVGQLHQVHAHFYYPAWIWKNDNRYRLFENHNVQHETYVGDVIHDHAKEFIRTNRDGPFFAYLPYLQPHSEYHVPEDSRGPYADKFPRRPYDGGREGYHNPEHIYATYAGMISRLDRYVGEIMTLLEELEIADNTILVFTSDNGPQGGGNADTLVEFFDGNGPLRGTKGDVYEGGIRVPFIARWPGHIQAGSESNLPIYFPDMMPTFADAAGTSAPENIDGISFLPELTGSGDQRRHEYMYWADYGSGADQDGQPRKHAVRSGDWKGVKFDGEPMELYNLTEDVGESNDVAADHPEIVEQMQTYFDRALSPRHDFEGVPQSGIEDFVW